MQGKFLYTHTVVHWQ